MLTWLSYQRAKKRRQTDKTDRWTDRQTDRQTAFQLYIVDISTSLALQGLEFCVV